MKNLVKKALETLTFNRSAKQAVDRKGGDTAVGRLDPEALDADLSGWFNFASGELLTGFRIDAEDVVLDIGCGDGQFSQFCAARGAAIIMADIDDERLQKAKIELLKVNPRALQTIATDANPLPLAAGTASKIIAMEVLEHVDDPDQFMREIVRVGQSGARYLISVPDPILEHLQKSLAAPSYYEKPNHVRIFQRDEFLSLINRSGLIVEQQTSYGFYWSMWWMFFWACKQDLAPPWHPLLENWKKTWGALLDTPQGPQIKKILDDFMPKSQAIIARKP